MVDSRLNAFERTAVSALGDALGYYRALAAGSLTAAELAQRTVTNERFAREWLARQAARGHIDYEPQTGRYFLNDEQRASLTGSSVDHTDAYSRLRRAKYNDSKVQGERGHGWPSLETSASPQDCAERFQRS